MWNELPSEHVGGTSTESIFAANGSTMRSRAATLATWIHPSRLLDGIRIMFKRDEADWNESGESHWFSVSYDTNKIATADELHHVNQMKRWDNDFLVLPYAIIYDVFLDDSILVSKGLVAGALDLYMSKVVNHHWSRNYSMFAEAQWAAALAKKGNAEQAQQCIDSVLSHQMREGKATNRDLMWLALAEKWIGDSEYVFR